MFTQRLSKRYTWPAYASAHSQSYRIRFPRPCFRLWHSNPPSHTAPPPPPFPPVFKSSPLPHGVSGRWGRDMPKEEGRKHLFARIQHRPQLSTAHLGPVSLRLGRVAEPWKQLVHRGSTPEPLPFTTVGVERWQRPRHIVGVSCAS